MTFFLLASENKKKILRLEKRLFILLQVHLGGTFQVGGAEVPQGCSPLLFLSV